MPSEPEIRVSVALVTRNRPDSLEICLKSWRAQTVRPFEIVVSDDSDDEHAAKSKELARSYDCRYVRGPRRGLYANRNSATRACQGSHILSADDDHSHPADYVEKVVDCIRQDPTRVWIFAERLDERDLARQLVCPPELHRSGHGQSPSNPANCAAIADGASVYPRDIFDSGLWYDETYRFGPLWYLWGRVLVKHGWRISFSDSTFVWHRAWTETRLDDVSALNKQLECMTYVLFVNAFWLNPSPVNLFWSFAYLIRRMLVPDSIVFYTVRSRLGIDSAVRALYLALTYPSRMSELSRKRSGCGD